MMKGVRAGIVMEVRKSHHRTDDDGDGEPLSNMRRKEKISFITLAMKVEPASFILATKETDNLHCKFDEDTTNNHHTRDEGKDTYIAILPKKGMRAIVKVVRKESKSIRGAEEEELKESSS